MEIIITESQLPRIVAMNWLIKHTQDFRRVSNEKTIKVISNNNEVIFEYDKSSNTLKVDYSRIWSFIYHQLKYDKDTSMLIIRAYAIDFLKLKELKYSGKIIVSDLNDFSKEFKLNEDENPVPPSSPPKINVPPLDIKPLDMGQVFERNPFLQKVIPQNQEFVKLVSKLPADEQLERLVGLLNQKNPNYKAKVNNGILNFNIKNPFVGQSQQIKNPIKVKGNADIRLFPTPKLNSLTVNLTIPI